MNTPREFICEFCNKKFSKKSNLSTHINKAKYCISKRPETKESDYSLLNKLHQCVYCNKSFTSRQFQLSHQKKCTKKIINDFESKLQDQKNTFENKLQEKDSLISTFEKQMVYLQEQKNMFESKLQDQKNTFENKLQEKDSLISTFEKQVVYLQEQLASVAIIGARKSTKITNNTTNNVTQILSPFDLDQKDIKSIIENKLDENSFLNSQRGIAKFCVDNILKTEDGKMRMICTDPARERFKYIDENGVIKEDIQARQFIEKIYPPIRQVGEKIHESLLEKCKAQLIKIAKGEDDTERYIVKSKEEASHSSWLDIRFIKSQTSNGTFRKELAILSNV